MTESKNKILYADKMDKLESPSDAQQTELLTVDSNGQAIPSSLYSGNIRAKLIEWLASDITGTFLLSEFVIFGTETISLGAGTKRIINESALIVLDGNLTIQSTVSGYLSLVIENHIYMNSNSKIVYDSDTTPIEIVSKYTSGATGVETLTLENTGSQIINYKYANWDGNIITTGLNNVQFNNEVFAISDFTKQVNGTVIDFRNKKVYNTLSSPATGNITLNETNARLGVVQTMYHASATTPTITGVTNIYRKGGTIYTNQTTTPGAINILKFEWVENDTVYYEVDQLFNV